jgi:hypothetical protein
MADSGISGFDERDLDEVELQAGGGEYAYLT